MPLISVLAVVPASDLHATRSWFTQLLGREPDAVPMPSDIEWHISGGGGIQVAEDAENSGSASITLGVDDIDHELAAIRERGLDVPAAETVPSGQFRIAMLQDPDGNRVVLAQTLVR